MVGFPDWLLKKATIVAIAMVGTAALLACSNQKVDKPDRSKIVSSIEVSKSEFEKDGLKWPILADKAIIGCLPDPNYPSNKIAWVSVDGVQYGLNGVATSKPGYSDITPIWLLDEKANKAIGSKTGSRAKIRVSLDDMVQKALPVCDNFGKYP